MRALHYLTLILSAAVAGAAELPASQHHFVVIAHRGDHTRAHENTLTALRNAIATGVDFAEIDVRRTLDGEHVLMHDRTVDRMTDGKGAVSELTLAQIRALHVRDPQRPQIQPDRIPTFAEVLSLIKGRLNIYLDFKDGDRAAVAQAIRQAGLTRQFLVYDDVESIDAWRRVAPELPLIVSPPDTQEPQELVAFARARHIEVLDGPWSGYSPAMVRAASLAGVTVWPDIQSSREDEAYFASVVARGFSGVQTDHPEELIAWLKDHNLR